MIFWIYLFIDTVYGQFGITYREPRLECSADGIKLHIEPLGLFTGHIYVKGYFQSRSCHLDYSHQRLSSPFTMDIPYRGDCNVRRHHSTHPTTVSYETTVIIQHHPMFITAGDRAYRLNCIYRQLDSTVTQRLNINELREEDVENYTKPSCSYDVTTSDGNRIRYANVGEQIIHTWRCDTPYHGFLVHSCTVRNDVGEEYKMVDERGCSTDLSLIPQLIYSVDLSTVSATMRAFRFADQMMVHFSCQLTLCRKEEDGCEGLAPPTCQPIHFGEIQTTYKSNNKTENSVLSEKQPTISKSSSELPSELRPEVLETETKPPSELETLSESVAQFADPEEVKAEDSELGFDENKTSDSKKLGSTVPSTLYTDKENGLGTRKLQQGSSKWLNGDEYEGVSSEEEYGLEIVDVGQETTVTAEKAHRSWLDNDQSDDDASGYRTRSLSSAVEVPAALKVVEESDGLPEPDEADTFFARRHPRSHDSMRKPVNSQDNDERANITMEVDGGEIIILASDNGPIGNVMNDEVPRIAAQISNQNIQIIGICSSIALQITLVSVIFIQRYYFRQRIQQMKQEERSMY